MPKPQKFEMHAYPGDADGIITTQAQVTEFEARDASHARPKAGRLAKKVNGPVDLAYAYEPGEPAQDWADRYITTARPDEYTVSGWSFERLD